jgi:hypothetical protein
VRTLALERARTLDFDDSFDVERARELAFDLDLPKAKLLADYLGACRLFVACLERARVSERAELRDRLLRAPEDRKQDATPQAKPEGAAVDTEQAKILGLS